MVTSNLGIDLIKHFESFFAEAYLCPAGIPTIGWGTIEYPNRQSVKLGDKCTREEADAYLAHELVGIQTEVLRMTEGCKLSQARFDALVSFAYNLGWNRLEGSSLLKRLRINQEDEDIIGSQNMKYQEWGRGGQFIKWNKVNGMTNKGLVRRRKAESWLYATGMNRFFEEMLVDTAEPQTYVSVKKI